MNLLLVTRFVKFVLLKSQCVGYKLFVCACKDFDNSVSKFAFVPLTIRLI